DLRWWTSGKSTAATIGAAPKLAGRLSESRAVHSKFRKHELLVDCEQWSSEPKYIRELKLMRKFLCISVLTAACTLMAVSGSQAQGYYQQEQDRKRAAKERQDLRQDYRERARDQERLNRDKARERAAERRGDWQAADRLSRQEDRDAAKIRRDNR